MGNMLHGIFEGMGIVIHRINAPLGSCAVVGGVVNSVYHRIPHVKVAAGQVNFSPKGHFAVFKLSGPHSAEQIQAFLLWAISIWAGGGSREVPPHFPHLFLAQFADIGQPLLNKLFGALVHLLKEIGSIVKTVAPVVAQPVDIVFNGIYIFHILFGGVCIIHTQVADSAKALCRAEVHVDGFCVANV